MSSSVLYDWRKKKKTLEGRPSEPHSHWSEVRSKRCCQLLPEGASQSLTSLLLHQLWLKVPPDQPHQSCGSQHVGFSPQCSTYQSQALQRALLIAVYFPVRVSRTRDPSWREPLRKCKQLVSAGPGTQQRNQQTSLAAARPLSPTCCKSPRVPPLHLSSTSQNILKSGEQKNRKKKTNPRKGENNCMWYGAATQIQSSPWL